MALPLTHPSSQVETLTRLVAIAEEGGRIALRFFRAGQQTAAGVEWKGDGSPITEADFAVNAYLESELRRLWPEAAWLSEESVDDPSRLQSAQVIIVDPIDGTRGFARGDAHWGLSIALVVDGRPVCAILHAPALGETYTAQAGSGAALNGTSLRLSDRNSLGEGLRVSCPGSLMKALKGVGFAFAFQPKIASLALRVAKVASSEYDAGLTVSTSHDWDIAAADLILTEAGGILADQNGRPLIYNRPDPTHGMLTATVSGLQPAFRAAVAKTSFGA